MRIHRLSTQLSNQIAAGEVIERPASVVKELLENSIDAGATEISIEIEQGGERLICVRDNGSGIHPDDLTLALDRHATSKILHVEDLAAIDTLGFRGEALASIDSVSRLELHSRVLSENLGWKIASGFGFESIPQERASMRSTSLPSMARTSLGNALETKAREAISVQKEPIAHPIGTSVIIRDLFYNTPARKKFLKNERVEFSHIENLIKRIALSHFHIGFKLTHNNKTIFQLPPAESVLEKEKRVASICGQEFLKHVVFVEIEHAGLKLSGWIAQPTFSRSQADIQYFYVNRRCVKDKVVTHAIRQAYEDVLYNQRHPAYVLFFELDPHLVDVNAHPTKHEVRFRESRMVHDFIFRSIHQAIEQIRPGDILENHTMHNRGSANDGEQGIKPSFTATGRGPTGGWVPEPGKLGFRPAETRPLISQQNVEQYQMLYQTAKSPDETLPDQIPVLGYAIAQLKGIYILAENEKGLVLVDMHAAHERILYEQMKEHTQQQGHLVAQPLLVPVTLVVTEHEADQVEAQHAFFEKLGLQVERLGPETLAVKQVPELLKQADIAQVLRDILADLVTFDQSQRLEEILNHIMGNMACKAAIKANHRLTLSEMNGILRAIEIIPRSGQCNHGRPTWIQLSLEELDKFFLRGR